MQLLARSLRVRPPRWSVLLEVRTAAGHATTSGLVNLVEDYKIIEDGRMSKPEECEDSPFEDEVDSDEDDEGNLPVAVAGAVELGEEEGAEQAYDYGAAPYMFEPRLPEGERLMRQQPRPENNERLHVLDW